MTQNPHCAGEYLYPVRISWVYILVNTLPMQTHKTETSQNLLYYLQNNTHVGMSHFRAFRSPADTSCQRGQTICRLGGHVTTMLT